MRLCLDTESLPAATRLDAWTDVMWDLCSPMAHEATLDGPFRAAVVADELGPLGLRHIRTDPYRGTQNRASVARACREQYILTITTRGSFDLSQFGRDVRIGEATATLHSTRDPAAFRHGSPSDALIVTIPAPLLRCRLGDPEARCATLLRPDLPAYSVLLDHIRSVVRNVGGMDRETREIVAEGVLDLLAAALGTGTKSAPGTGSAVQHAHLRRIRTYIDSNLHDPGLGPAQIAAASGISKRYLHHLFRVEGCSVGEWVRGRRLERIHQALEGDAFDGLTIAEVATRHGFLNSSHFSAAFRARFGRTPRDVRGARTPCRAGFGG